MALGRRFGHDAGDRCLLLLEEHEIDGCLEIFRQGDAFGLSVDYQIAA